MTQSAVAVVRRQIIDEAPVERATTVFTERFGDFKPRGIEDKQWAIQRSCAPRLRRDARRN
jgi:hypothetical protein